MSLDKLEIKAEQLITSRTYNEHKEDFIMSDDIIVTGRVNHSGQVYGYDNSSGPPPMHPGFDPGSHPGGGGGGSDPNLAYSISVRVHVTNPDHLTAAEEAARALIRALAKLKTDSQNNPSATVTIDGLTFSLSDIVTQIGRTNWTITDASYTDTNGVGAATFNPTGQSVDEISFSAIVGSSGYDSPNYPNGEGMMALVLHELVHLSSNGLNLYNRSVAAWHLEGSGNTAYNLYGGPYGANLERLINDIMVAVANAGGLDIGYPGTTPVLPGSFQGGQLPEDLYSSRNP